VVPILEANEDDIERDVILRLGNCSKRERRLFFLEGEFGLLEAIVKPFESFKRRGEIWKLDSEKTRS
jgi:hypothetical protein